MSALVLHSTHMTFYKCPNAPTSNNPIPGRGYPSEHWRPRLKILVPSGRSEQKHNITNSEAPQTQNHDCLLLPKESPQFQKLLEVAAFGLSCVLVNPGLGDFLRAGREARHLCLGVGESARHCLLNLLRGRKATCLGVLGSQCCTRPRCWTVMY